MPVLLTEFALWAAVGAQKPPTDHPALLSPRWAPSLPQGSPEEAHGGELRRLLPPPGECGAGSALFKLCTTRFTPQGLREKGLQEGHKMVTEILGASGQRAAVRLRPTCQVVSFFAPPSVLWADVSPGPPVPAPGPGPGSACTSRLPGAHCLWRSTRSAHPLSQHDRANRESKKPGTGSTSGPHML